MICFEKEATFVERQNRVSLPLMSLVVLFYNQSQYVESAVAGALSQDWQNCEIVFSDDCSTDDTLEKILTAVKRYEGPHRVVVNSRSVNCGIGAHVKDAFSLCNGDWVVVQGGDDVSVSNRVSVIAGYAKNNKSVSAVGVGAIAINEAGDRCGDSKTVEEPVIYRCCRNQTGIACTLDPGKDASICLITGAMAAYRKDVVEMAPIPEDIVAEDVFLTHRAALVGDIAFLPEKCVLQRICSTSLSRGGKGSKTRKERQRFRKRISRMAYLSFDALLTECDGYDFEVGEGYKEYIAFQRATLLLHCFALGPLSRESFTAYAQAFSMARKGNSIYQILNAAAKRGVGCRCFMLLLASMVHSVCKKSGHLCKRFFGAVSRNLKK